MKTEMKGRRIELIEMDDLQTTLKPGDKGTIQFVDDIGQIHVSWDKGSQLAIIPGVDKYKLL